MEAAWGEGGRDGAVEDAAIHQANTSWWLLETLWRALKFPNGSLFSFVLAHWWATWYSPQGQTLLTEGSGLGERDPWVSNHTSSFLTTISSCSKESHLLLVLLIRMLHRGSTATSDTEDSLGCRICLSTLRLPLGPNWQHTRSSIDWMWLKRAFGINNQQEGSMLPHFNAVFLKWESGDGNWCWDQYSCYLHSVLLNFAPAVLSRFSGFHCFVKASVERKYHFSAVQRQHPQSKR